MGDERRSRAALTCVFCIGFSLSKRLYMSCLRKRICVKEYGVSFKNGCGCTFFGTYDLLRLFKDIRAMGKCHYELIKRLSGIRI